MTYILQVNSPVDNSIYAERLYASAADISDAMSNAVRAQQQWQASNLKYRKAICLRAVEAMLEKQLVLGEEISWQMGRPIRYTPGEINGFAERARAMIEIAEQKLAGITLPEKAGFTRYIERAPLGVVFSIVPWNYPYLTAVNSIIPAIMAGNAVIMKPSSQTPLTAERIGEALDSAGLPKGIFQHLLLNYDSAAKIIQSDQVNYIAFTGSVSGGHMVEQAAAGRFVDVGLELGGKDPAYVRSDVDLEFAIDNLVDGVYFNSGQSCCGIERIYVHKDIYNDFVDGFINKVKEYRLGNPLEQDTTLGPMVSNNAAENVRRHIKDAIARGAKACIDANEFSADQQRGPYLAPQVLLKVDHSMQVMTEETFGPVAGIMQVTSDEEAIELVNDSKYGLTASVWTQDQDAAINIGNQINTGTWFMNRCDYLDPELAWTGVKDSGKGCTLSEVGYEKLTRPKSFHLRTSTR
ncbi:MAG: aldehyde dehydrogenase family protein [Gammaproteobacteria bacterium]|jgi:acyl-CoA reductase-like NAD-dependent aldehyde dehydrogenase